MTGTVYDAVGGTDVFVALAHAHHARCLADPELNHPFSHPGLHPHHVQRLAAYWAEVLGGPPSYSQMMGDESSVVGLHAGNGDMTDLSRRFVDCFVASYDEAGVPDEAELRRVLTDYMTWATETMNSHPAGTQDVPDRLPMPRWSWGGLVVTPPS